MTDKAPERIYVVDTTFPDYVDFDGSPINTKRIDDHDIEYTRTDAFVEKACDYINRHLALLDAENNDGMPKWLEKFKEAMKGE